MNEVGHRCECNENTINERISEEENEKLVVGETNTVIDPWAVLAKVNEIFTYLDLAI